MIDQSLGARRLADKRCESELRGISEHEWSRYSQKICSLAVNCRGAKDRRPARTIEPEEYV